MATRRTSPVTDLALIAVFAGITAAFTLAPAIPVGPVGVPITLQTLAVSLAALILGGWRGAAAIALYVLVGIAGLPVFAGGFAGPGILAKPSFGYLLAFPIAAFVLGLVAQRVIGRRLSTGKTFALLLAAGIATRLLIIYPLGVAGMMVNAKLPLMTALVADTAYWPGDLVKQILAIVVAMAVHRAFPTLLGAPDVRDLAAAERV